MNQLIPVGLAFIGSLLTPLAQAAEKQTQTNFILTMKGEQDSPERELLRALKKARINRPIGITDQAVREFEAIIGSGHIAYRGERYMVMFDKKAPNEFGDEG